MNKKLAFSIVITFTMLISISGILTAQTKTYLESIHGYEYDNYTQGKATLTQTFEYHGNQALKSSNSTYFSSYNGDNDGIYYSKTTREYNKKSKCIKTFSKHRESIDGVRYSNNHFISNFEEIEFQENDTIIQSYFHAYSFNNELTITDFVKGFYKYDSNNTDTVSFYRYTLTDPDNFKYDSVINKSIITHNYTDSSVTFKYYYWGNDSKYLSSKEVKHYNNIGNLSNQKTYFYHGNEIFATTETTWAYDEYGRDTLRKEISYENQSFRANYIERTKYNNLDQVIYSQEIRQTSDHFNSDIDKTQSIREYDYDLSGNCLQFRMFYQNNNGALYQSSQVDYFFNQDTILNEIIIKTTLPNHSELHPELRYTITTKDHLLYDDIVSNSMYYSSLIPFAKRMKRQRAIDHVITYKYIDNEWQPEEFIKATYKEREFIESKEETDPINVYIYPNPCSDYVSIETDEDAVCIFQLYNSNSQPILERKFLRDIRLNLSQLSNGMYFYRITSAEGFEKTQKLIISR